MGKGYCRRPEADAVIQGYLNLIVATVSSVTPPSALVLIGSYGRGEGAVKRSTAGWDPVNDFDLVFVSKGPLGWWTRRALKQRRTIAGLPHIDLMMMTERELAAEPVSMLRYDMKRAAHILTGSEGVLDLIPSELFSAEEVRNLLVNRLVTLLEAHPLVSSPQDGPRQLSKVFWALVDARSFKAGAHYSRYQDKYDAVPSFDDPMMSHLRGWALDTFGAPEGGSVEQGTWNIVRDQLITALEEVAISIDGYARRPGYWRGYRMHPLNMNIFGRFRRFEVEQKILDHLSNRETGLVWARTASHLITEWYGT